MKPLKWENLEAEKLAQWLRYNQYRFTHIWSEAWQRGTANIIAMMARKKRMWTSPWFPDYCIILKRSSLLFLELKRPRPILKSWKLWASPSKVSEEQEGWIEALSRIDNVEAMICYWADESIKLIETLEVK